MPSTAIYGDVGDIFDAVEDIAHLKSIGAYRTTSFYLWLNKIQVEWQRLNPCYEPLRTADTITLTAGTYAYAFSAIDASCIAVDVRSFHNGLAGGLIKYRPEHVIRRWDRGWTATGTVGYFTVRPGYVWFYPKPSAAYVASYPTVYLDYFTRLSKFTTEADTLTQYPEPDRVLLVRGMTWMALKEQDDPEWRALRDEWELAVRSANGMPEAQGVTYQIGLGPYFDSDLDEEF